ncbi:MAG: pseudouridine-5'-phosphate glycosidase [bacterium]
MRTRVQRAGRSARVHLNPEVTRTVRARVALESAVFSHGLPADAARGLAAKLDRAVRSRGATPVLVAVKRGRIEAGIGLDDIEFLLDPKAVKIAERDLAVAVAEGRSGGTTVAATLAVASRAGISVMATGGIGGVHLDAPDDVSADLYALSRYPIVVVCAGAKIICDPRRTVEALETLGVAVVGYQTDTFPAFIARSSGIPVPHRAEDAAQIAAIVRARTELGMSTALLVVQPAPADVALDPQAADAAVAYALERARAARVAGPALTPFLLSTIADITGGRSLIANLRLLEANASLAADIAVALAAHRRRSPAAKSRPDLIARRERRSAKGSGRP